jgi:hypothetical protein
MILKIISGILILVTVYLNFKHGWAGITNKLEPEEAKMMTDIGLTRSIVLLISILSLLVCILTLLPRTFFIGNIINATSILIIIAFALNAKNYKLALIEIPFLLIPLFLIWAGHPLKR